MSELAKKALKKGKPPIEVPVHFLSSLSINTLLRKT